LKKLLAALVLSAAAWPFALRAQTYPDMRPVPRTTDRAVLSAQVLEREVRERFRIGFEAELQGRWREACVEFERIIVLHPAEPGFSSAYYDLGLARAQLREYEAAAASFRAAVVRDPEFIAARANLVSVDLLRNDLVAARRDADDLITRAPSSARALYERGVTALRSGDNATALHDFGALLASNPAYATGRYDLALAQIESGRLDDAERELRSALALAPTYARARFTLGVVELRIGKKQDARADFDRAAHDAQDVTLRNLAISLRDAL